jgi:ABC-type uncharacterized transport system involved in gliding motility auxiliary subunit
VRLKAFIKGKKLRSLFPRALEYGTNVFIVTFLVLGILIFIGILSVHHNWKLDLTENKRYSLSPQTVKLLQGLTQQVKAKAFYQQGGEGREGAQYLFRQYADRTKRFTYEFIDPDRQPAKAKQYAITNYGTVVLECGTRLERLDTLTEATLTNAIIRATRQNKKIVYFLQGHGEHGLTDEGRAGYSAIKKAVEEQNYIVRPLLLLRSEGVPADAALVVIGGPQKDLLPQEITQIRRYMEGGGKLLIMTDPFTGRTLKGFIDGYGLHVGDDIIIDKMSKVLGGDYGIPVVSDYTAHPITENFGEATFFPMAQTIQIDKSPPKDTEIVPLAKTGTESWGEVDRARLAKGEAEFNKGQDRPGPLTVAAVATRSIKSQTMRVPGKNARLVLVGDSDFVSNSFFAVAGNGDFFLNALSWLAEEGDLIAVRPKPPKISPLFLSPAEARWIKWLTIAILPGLVACAGVVVLVRRRRRR